MRKNTLIWIDLEMTGLDPEENKVVEVASIVTDTELNELEEGPSLVIHQSEEVLAAMGPWCQKQHGKSGLTDAVRSSTITLEQAEDETLKFVMKHCDRKNSLLCGNTVWMDRIFLARYMPRIINYLTYRLIDVTSIAQLVKRWYPKNPLTDFKKAEIHRALPDIRESIAELRHYKNYFFIPQDWHN